MKREQELTIKQSRRAIQAFRIVLSNIRTFKSAYPMFVCLELDDALVHIKSDLDEDLVITQFLAANRPSKDVFPDLFAHPSFCEKSNIWWQSYHDKDGNYCGVEVKNGQRIKFVGKLIKKLKLNIKNLES